MGSRGQTPGGQVATPQPTPVAPMPNVQGAGGVNPFQQAAAAQTQALGATTAGTTYATDPRAMNRMSAGMNYQAPTAATNALTAGSNYQANQAAMGGFQQAMGYNPQNVQGTSYQAAQQAGPDRAAVGLSAYMNPYQQQVINPVADAIERQRQLSNVDLASRAAKSKAFGSRRDVEQDRLDEAAMRQTGQALSPLYNTGYNQALQAAQFDVGQQSAIGRTNVGFEDQARRFGAQQGMTAQQLNQAAGLQGANLNLQGSQAMSQADLAAANARRASAASLGSQAAQSEQLGMTAARTFADTGRQDMATRLQAANQLSNLGRTSFGYGTAIQDRMAAQGAQQRGIQQQLIDQAQAEQQRYRGGPAQGLNTMLGTVTGQTGNLTGNTVSQNPGLFNYLQVASQFGQ